LAQVFGPSQRVDEVVGRIAVPIRSITACERLLETLVIDTISVRPARSKPKRSVVRAASLA